ncbi:MAG: hypothetical protein ACOC98_05755, partial [Thermodesulfobacteriota bacterium]
PKPQNLSPSIWVSSKKMELRLLRFDPRPPSGEGKKGRGNRSACETVWRPFLIEQKARQKGENFLLNFQLLRMLTNG